MSVRVRLTLWYLFMLCLGLAAFGGAVLWQTQQAALASLQDTVRHRATDVRADLELKHALVLKEDAADESDRRPGEPTFSIRVLDTTGRIVVSQGPQLPGLPATLRHETQPGFHNAELAHEHYIMVYVLPVTQQHQQIGTIQIFTTTDDLDTMRRQLIVAMALASAAIVIAAGLAGLFLANRALRPVDRITRAAAEIGEGDLHRRVGTEMTGRGRRIQARDDELGRLVRTFDGMLGRLDEASERRRQLTADAAHELCTPIATISSAAEIALRRPRSFDEYRDALRGILDESHHMSRIVDDLLLLARADAGRLPLAHDLVEIDEVCRQAAQALQPLAVETRVTLSIDLPAHAVLVMGDEMRLSQLVRNLLDNALRYTPAGGAVTLTLHEAPATTDGHVVIAVEDTGPGIPPEERERIFERFHRLQGDPAAGEQHQRADGSGLGLAICRAIAQAHGGRINVENAAAGSGSRFVVELPAVVPGGIEESALA